MRRVCDMVHETNKRERMRKILKSARETKAAAARIAVELLRDTSLKRKTATVIGLVGELGAGKTTFIQGFAKKLGIQERLTSPTFLIFRSYPLPKKKTGQFTKLYHVDLYRLHSVKEATSLGFREILKNPGNLLLIEWADRIRNILPKSTWWVTLHHGKKISERKISIS